MPHLMTDSNVAMIVGDYPWFSQPDFCPDSTDDLIFANILSVLHAGLLSAIAIISKVD